MGRCFLLKWHDGVEVRAAGSLDVFKFFLENYILLYLSKMSWWGA